MRIRKIEPGADDGNSRQSAPVGRGPAVAAETEPMRKFRRKMAAHLGDALERRDVPRATYVLMRIRKVVEARDH